MDSNHRSRKTADLQSAPFGHSGICPCHYFRKRICDSFQLTRFCLSLLSDSNQRPRDYKSRALANWAKEATSFVRRYCRKASANVRLFFELQNFFHFFFKKSTKNLVFPVQELPKVGKTDTEEPDCQQQHSVHLPPICVAKIVKGEWRTKQIHLFFYPEPHPIFAL